MLFKPVLLLAAAEAVSAHFGLTTPSWRADTLAAENEAKYSQWNYPCAGVPYKAGNVTEIPLNGTTVQLELHHPWTYVFVNLGLGANATNFNISLTPDLTNSTGKGTLCLSDLPWPKDIADGTLASLQVVTSGAGGSALYNCADVKFSKDAKAADKCETSKGVSASVVKAQGASGTNGTASNSTSSKGGDGKSAGNAMGANMVMAGSVAGLAAAFAVGLL